MHICALLKVKKLYPPHNLNTREKILGGSILFSAVKSVYFLRAPFKLNIYFRSNTTLLSDGKVMYMFMDEHGYGRR